MFTPYLYESQGIEIPLSNEEIDTIFWDAAAPRKPTTSSNYMFRKPNRRIFDLALEKAELAPEEVWYIGGQYECDIKGALSAGLFPVWYVGAIDLPYAEAKNILTVNSWKELRQRMEMW